MMLEETSPPPGAGRFEMPLYRSTCNPTLAHCGVMPVGTPWEGTVWRQGNTREWISLMMSDKAYVARKSAEKTPVSTSLSCWGWFVLACAFRVGAGSKPEYLGQSVLIREDNMSSIH